LFQADHHHGKDAFSLIGLRKEPEVESLMLLEYSGNTREVCVDDVFVEVGCLNASLSEVPQVGPGDEVGSVRRAKDCKPLFDLFL